MFLLQDLFLGQEYDEEIAREISKRETLLVVGEPSNDTWARDHGFITLVDDQGDARLLDFFFNGDNRKEAPAMLIHEYYPYTEEDMNKWYDLREDVIPMFTAKKKDLLYIAYEEESEDA